MPETSAPAPAPEATDLSVDEITLEAWGVVERVPVSHLNHMRALFKLPSGMKAVPARFGELLAAMHKERV